jgi:hypothetical protein
MVMAMGMHKEKADEQPSTIPLKVVGEGKFGISVDQHLKQLILDKFEACKGL